MVPTPLCASPDLSRWSQRPLDGIDNFDLIRRGSPVRLPGLHHACALLPLTAPRLLPTAATRRLDPTRPASSDSSPSRPIRQPTPCSPASPRVPPSPPHRRTSTTAHTHGSRSAQRRARRAEGNVDDVPQVHRLLLRRPVLPHRAALHPLPRLPRRVPFLLGRAHRSVRRTSPLSPLLRPRGFWVVIGPFEILSHSLTSYFAYDRPSREGRLRKRDSCW